MKKVLFTLFTFVSGMVFGVTLVSYLQVVGRRIREEEQKMQEEEDYDYWEDTFCDDLDFEDK